MINLIKSFFSVFKNTLILNYLCTKQMFEKSYNDRGITTKQHKSYEVKGPQYIFNNSQSAVPETEVKRMII